MKRLFIKKISPPAEERGTNQDYSEDSSDVFVGPGAVDDFVRLQRFIKSMHNTKNFHNMFAKLCTLHSLMHTPVLLSASYLQKMGKFLNQVLSGEWRPSICPPKGKDIDIKSSEIEDERQTK